MRRIGIGVGGSSAVVVLAVIALSYGMSSVAAEEPHDILADAGYGYYVEYCAVCHGPTGNGDGPLAEELKRVPSDLTKITERHGSFPQPLLVEIIDGRRRTRGHGPSEMPVWGRVFSRQQVGSEGGDLIIRARIQLLVAYLRSIQTK